MSKELEIWDFIAKRLRDNIGVELLVVAESTGSSPGRQGYKMAVADDGDLVGSIGGGVMEVNLVEQARATLSAYGAIANGVAETALKVQTHRKDVPDSSGMICSGTQTIVFRHLTPTDLITVETVIGFLKTRASSYLTITPILFVAKPDQNEPPAENSFEKVSDTDFVYIENIGKKNDLYIVGGGHCALALSELMSRMDFQIHILDDRPELNTIEKNRFADRVTIVDSYHKIADHIPPGDDVYVVVMTLGYLSDAVVIRKLIDHQVKYFGVLGSKAKMATLIKELSDEGLASDKLSRIRTPIGLPINSRTPEEIAVSIAAEIISVKNL